MQAPKLFIPPHVLPAERWRNRLSFMAAFVRNPLEVIPRAAYEEDFVPPVLAGGKRVWISEPGLIKAVLLDERDNFEKLTQVRLLAPLLGRGILTSERAEWKWQRQASAPMFRPASLLAFVPTFVRMADAMVQGWRAQPNGTVHPIDMDLTRATFEVISATLLPSAERDMFEHSIHGFQRSGGWSQLYATMNMPKWMPRPGFFAGARAITTLRAAVAAMIQTRRSIPEGARPDDLLHRLMLSQDPETAKAMNDEQLIDNLLTFYLAGHDTTAKALTWTLYLLARSPEWTTLLQEEIAGVTGGGPIAGDHVERLALVRQVVKESMRLYPPVPIMSRQCVAPARIGTHDISPGMSVLIPIYAMHRHKRRWENPDAFDPGRFAPEREAQIPRYQYMPFGAGPRICIGMSFAMLEATAMLAAILQQASFDVVGAEPLPVARVTLIPKDGMPLRVLLK